jgi:hypothetical protein
MITPLSLLIILSVAYVINYYRLENGVQKWYRLSNEIRNRFDFQPPSCFRGAKLAS